MAGFTYFTRTLDAATGYCELQMWSAAWEELESLPPDDRAHPDVLRLRLGVFIGLQRWECAALLAESLVDAGWTEASAFVMGSGAIRRCRSLPEALEFLSRGAELLRKDATYWYTRACCVCQLGDLEAAKISISRAFKLEPDLRAIALEEQDLEPLLDSLATEWPAAI
jgi:tetratricopeptide (TPR) repeat protein